MTSLPTRLLLLSPGWVRLTLILVVLVPRSATALEFDEITTPDNKKVLLARDCEDRPDAHGSSGKCQPFETHVSGASRQENGTTYPGDAAVLDQILSTHHDVSQVWLASGGGALDEGLKLGRVLRAHGQFTYVPEGVHCASSCTVAFLGGVLRDVNPKAEFLVHAPSVFLEPSPKLLRALVGPDGEFALVELVGDISERARTSTGELLMYVQTMIGGAPSAPAITAALASGLPFADVYRNSGRLKSDAPALHSQGEIWVHDRLMSLEREASEYYLAMLGTAEQGAAGSGQPGLGKRAREALRIIENMYRSRITGTFQLDQTTLHEMGYTNVKH